MEAPQISIVIPVYNAQEWIEATLTSIIKQTCAPKYLEIVLVDDGSTDNGIIAAQNLLEHSTIRFEILRISNGGPSRARNIGWRHSCGTWIQFLDADDLLHPVKLATQLAVATQCASDVAVVYSDWQRLVYREEKWQQSGVRCQPDPHIDALEDILLTENFISTGSQLFRRTWLEEVCGFDERHWLIEDVDLLLRIAIAGGRFHYVPSEEPLFFYRQHASSLSRRDQQAFIEGCVRNARMVERYWHSKQALTILQINVLTNIYFQATRHFAGYDWTAFEAMMQQIEQLNPQFLPPAPRMLRMMSRAVGYRRAEKLAWRYRHIKAHVNALLGKSSA